MRKLRLIFIAALAAIVLGTLGAYWLNPPVSLPVLDTRQAPALDADGKPRLQGLSYTQVTDGVKKWQLEAKRAKLDDATGVITLFNVKIKFFQEGGGIITIKAKRGDYDQKNHLVGLKGRVRGRTSDGMSLKTEALTYIEKKQMVDTDFPVTVSGKRFKIHSKGMSVFVPDERILFKRRVNSTFIPVGSGPPPGKTAEATEKQ